MCIFKLLRQQRQLGRERGVHRTVASEKRGWQWRPLPAVPSVRGRGRCRTDGSRDQGACAAARRGAAPLQASRAEERDQLAGPATRRAAARGRARAPAPRARARVARKAGGALRDGGRDGRRAPHRDAAAGGHGAAAAAAAGAAAVAPHARGERRQAVRVPVARPQLGEAHAGRVERGRVDVELEEANLALRREVERVLGARKRGSRSSW